MWKAGDKCFIEFRAGTIEKVEPDGRVSGVIKDGGLLGGHDLRTEMQPVSPEVERISKEFSQYYEKIRNISNDLNFPDIHEWMIKRWVEVCDSPSKFQGSPELKCPSCGSTKLIKNHASGIVTCLKCNHKTDTYEALKQGEKPSQPADDGLDSGE